MVLTFSAILAAMLFLFRPLQRNRFFVLHAVLVIGCAYFVETHFFKVTPFVPKTFLLFLVFQLISINLVTILAYGVDKRAAISGEWRVPEAQLHTLELLGGWCGAFIAQKLFRHKTKKKSFRAVFWLMLFFQIFLIWAILSYLRLL